MKYYRKKREKIFFPFFLLQPKTPEIPISSRQGVMVQGSNSDMPRMKRIEIMNDYMRRVRRILKKTRGKQQILNLI
jgi:hypothetical protein